VFAWNSAIAADKRITHATARVAYVISQHVNRGTGSAWPGLICIAQEANVAESTVEIAIRDLNRFGYLGITPGKRGRGYSNTYRMNTPTIGVIDEMENPDHRGNTDADDADITPIDDPKYPDWHPLNTPTIGVEPTYRTNLRTKERESLAPLADAPKRVSLSREADQGAVKAIRMFGAKHARQLVEKLVDAVGEQAALGLIEQAATMPDPRFYIDAVIAASSSA
jgi:hypothetical protein